MFKVGSEHIVVFSGIEEGLPIDFPAQVATVINIDGDFLEIKLDESTCVTLSKEEFEKILA